MEKLKALKNKEGIQFIMNDNPLCPHCGEVVDVVENELWELYNDDDDHDVECPHCELEFRVSTYTSHKFSTDEQDEED